MEDKKKNRETWKKPAGDLAPSYARRPTKEEIADALTLAVDPNTPRPLTGKEIREEEEEEVRDSTNLKVISARKALDKLRELRKIASKLVKKSEEILRKLED